MEAATHTNASASLLSLLRLPEPSERGPLARIAPDDRVCHRCRRRLSVTGPGRLSIHRPEGGRVQITCDRCLSSGEVRANATTLWEARLHLRYRELEAKLKGWQ